MTLAGTGGAVATAPASAAAPSASTSSLLDCSGATTPGSSPSNLTDVDGTLFFTASDAKGSALWRSDGTAGSTVLLKRLGSGGYYGYDDYENGRLVGVGDTLFFSVQRDEAAELWRSDGTKAGTVRVKRFPAGDNDEYGADGPENLTAVGNTLFFTASDDEHGEELWKSNGTAAGTVMVANIQTGQGSGGEYSYGPDNLTAAGDTLFFTADNGTAGQEVWKSDGTAAGTVLVKDIHPGSYSSYAGELTPVGDTVFFKARDGVHGRELWRTDGTAAGTELVEDIRPGGASSQPYALVGVGDTLFFSAAEENSGRDLWVSDGSEAGTVRLKDFNSLGEEYDYGLREITPVGDTVFFSASDGTHGVELWSSDGTEVGTVMVKDIRPGDYSGYPYALTEAGGTLFFTARDGVHGQELWRSDGTEAGTSLVKDIRPNAGRSRPRELTESGGQLFLRADDGLHGDELWVSDGTEAGTSIVLDINTGGAFLVSSRPNLNAEEGTLRVRAYFDGSGTLTVAPTGKGGIRRVERDVEGSESVRLNVTLELTRAAKRTLRRTGRVEVEAKFTFASCGGAIRSVNRNYTLKMR